MRASAIVAVGILAFPLLDCRPAGTGPQAAADVAQAKDRAAIDSLRTLYAATWKSGNAVQLAELYAADGLVLYPHQPAVTGRPAILAYFTGFFAAFEQAQFELTSEEIQVAGLWAFDRGTVRWRGVPKDGGSAQEDQEKYLVVLQRQPDGTWRVARDMDNSDRPLPER